MTISRRPSPFGELLSLRQAMDRLFEDSFVRAQPGWTPGAADFGIPLDVTQTGDALVIEAALPGIRPEDVEITVEQGTLTIRGTSREERSEKQGEALVREIRRGEFTRSVGLPTGLEPERAEATFEDGVLKLTIPRAEQVKPRQIRISPTTDARSDRNQSASGAQSSQA